MLSASLTLTPDLRKVARLKSSLETLARGQIPESEILPRLTLCAEEIATNIITHGDAEPGTGDIRVFFEIGADQGILVFEDQGIPFDPTGAAPPTAADSLQDAPLRGFGIHLATHFSSRMDYQRIRDTNRLILRSISR
jgi:anti-sigma regulatory factor (Ser/Thr protein kinase)